MASTRAPRHLALVLACAASLAGCAALFGFEELRDSVAGSDAAPDVPQPDAMAPLVDAGADAPPAPACFSPLESLDGSPLVGGTTRHFALRSLGFTRFENGASIPTSFGANLDDDVTLGLDASPCAFWSQALSSNSPLTRFLLDDECGVDNTALSLFSNAEGAEERTDSLFTRATAAAIPAGMNGALLSVAGLREGADDATFLGAFWAPTYQLTRGADASAASCAPRPTVGAGLEPDFADRWCTDARFLNDAGQSRIRGNGSLTGGVVVLRLADLYLPNADPADYDASPGPHFSYMHLRNVRLSARMVPTAGGHFELVDGMIVGTWATRDLYFQQAVRNDSECDISPAGLDVLELLCYARDLRSAAGAGSCDSISVGLAFSAYEVEGLGPAIAAPAWEYGCVKVRDAGVPDTPDVFGQDCPTP